MLLLTGKSCKHSHKWEGKLWKADHETQSLIRKDVYIYADDPRFSNYVCMTVDDYVKIVKLLDQYCKE